MDETNRNIMIAATASLLIAAAFKSTEEKKRDREERGDSGSGHLFSKITVYTDYSVSLPSIILSVVAFISLETVKSHCSLVSQGSLLREKHGMYEALTKEMEASDHELFFQTYRMSKEQMDFIASCVSSLIEKNDTVMRPAIVAKCRLAMTLRVLASGDSMFSLSIAFRVSRAALSGIIMETCQALWTVLQPLYMKPPTEEDLKLVSREFNDLWQFPNCIGAADGKHCRIHKPPNSGSDYHNFHDFESIVLMAVVDARYRFLYIDVGAKGKENDSTVFKRSSFGKALEVNRLPVPDKKIFNYRLSRARRVVENTFGILASRFRVLKSTMMGKLETIDHIVKAVCVLHNFLMVTNAQNGNSYFTSVLVDREANGQIIPGSWRRQSIPILPSGNISGNFSGRDALKIHEAFKDYFCGVGRVPWQDEAILRGNF
ncbi:hypothetical protein QYM36_003001 [Artemia franciscana]|uniref:DDE Tnp4 domain-containing protein n=1 Tax=Artemia franciscana TaxID=6661 RepID=A0AA88L8S1_ARTSF|nr:hypothetical protein QYM36_003001 [Artemia franciscana]